MSLLSELVWREESIESMLRKLIDENVKWREQVCCAFPQDPKSITLVINQSRTEKFSAVTRYVALRC